MTDSDPWCGQDCSRETCWLCETKLLTGKNTRQECTKRNLVYETYCISCEERDMRELGEKEGNENKNGERVQVKLHKYVGETCRSVWERATEHLADLRNLSPASHLLKHILDRHEEENMEEIRFGIRIVKYTRSPFERQILESVKIQQERQHHFLLNSRAEYNRCSLPRLTAKIGEKDYKRWEKEEVKEMEKDERLKEKIIRMKNERMKKQQEDRKQSNKERHTMGD